MTTFDGVNILIADPGLDLLLGIGARISENRIKDHQISFPEDLEEKTPNVRSQPAIPIVEADNNYSTSLCMPADDIEPTARILRMM